jgi:hypothetical protein
MWSGTYSGIGTYGNPGEKFIPSLKNFVCPSLVSDNESAMADGRKWFDRIVGALREIGIPELAFNMQDDESELIKLVRKFKYASIHALADE